MNFIAFDLETTGIVAGVDRIVEIGAVKFLNGSVDSIFSTLVDPQISIPAGASAVNGISDEMVKGKPLIHEILGSLTDFMESLPLVAHNAPFDTQFLVSEYVKHEIGTPSGVILDTLPLSKKLLPGLANYKLSTLVQHLKIPPAQYHRAEQDATLCGMVFSHLIGRVQSGGVQTIVDADKIVSLMGKPALKFPVVERKPKQLDFLSLI